MGVSDYIFAGMPNGITKVGCVSFQFSTNDMDDSSTMMYAWNVRVNTLNILTNRDFVQYGCWGEQVIAIIVFVINIIVPGVGTLLSGFLGSECQKETIYVAIGQALTTPIFGIGLIWAIIWSFQLFRSSRSASDEENPLVPEGS